MSLSKKNGFILLGSALFWMMGSEAMAEGGYLVRVGPGPLRFVQAAPRLDPSLVLPPLKMTDESTTTNTVESVPPVTDETDPEAAPEIKPDDPSQSPILVPEPAPASNSDADTNTLPVAGQVTPQMLLRFFTPNKRAAAAPEPLQFTPPPPPAPASSRGSSASYVSP
ncbi:MAG TPA: hypothetical protein VGR78_16070 [Verrucomicrobiae bacterium]|nr:hypothetical protein [Verrucomicrobiae bacterium]